MTSRRSLVFGLGLAPILAACGGPPAPAVVEVQVRASADANRDTGGAPVAVAVRLYALTGRGRFMSADVYALMERERAVLGDESAGSEEIVMRPGESRSIKVMPKPGARYLGAAVLFRDIDRASWRTIAPIAESGTTRLTLQITNNKADLVQA